MSEEIKADILLVDDEEKLVEALSKRLQMRGLQVDTSTSGEDALEKIRSKNFDAIVLDLAMPGLDGIETLKRIKNEKPELQIIMLTGRGTVEKSVEAMKAGAIDFLEKPADVNILLDKIGDAKRKRILFVMKNIEEKMKGGLKRRIYNWWLHLLGKEV